MTPDEAEFAAWLRLLETPRLGREAARVLLAAFGSPQAVLGADPAALRGVVPRELAEALQRLPPHFEQRLATALAWIDGGPRRQYVTLGDPAYPPALLQTADPPLLLYVEGAVELLASRSLAIVGSRNPSAQGIDNARAFAAALAARGYTIVSGLALGIDGAAHEGALAAPGRTVAVVGTGLDIDYPRRHSALARRIAETGALVSEYAPGSPPVAQNFPLRNRIIAGLSLGTLVVEAAVQSGSLITARMAAEAGREVFAIPGSIHSPQSRGCHALIRQGAKLVESAADVLEEIEVGAVPTVANKAGAGDPGSVPSAQGAEREDPILAALGHDPMSMDALCARTGWPVSELGARLLDLELEGRVARLPGGLYQRRGTA